MPEGDLLRRPASARAHPPRRARRYAGTVVVFLAAFVAVGGLVRLVAPPDPDSVYRISLTPKLEHLATTAEHYDLVLVGNSRALRGLDPEVIDAERARAGCPGRTFNLAAQAMSKLELDDALDHLDDLPGGQPEMIATVDVAHLSVGFMQDFDLDQRVHMRIPELPRYVSYRAHLPAPYFRSGPLARADTAAGFVANLYPAGLFHRRLFPAVPVDDPAGGALDGRGYLALEDLPRAAERRVTLDRLIAGGGWERRWRPRRPGPDQLDDWVRTIRAHVDAVPAGSRPLHVLIPSEFDAGTAAAVTEAWEAAGEEAPLLNLVDEDAVGRFTDPAFWFDRDHLSRAGAVATSRALGRRICDVAAG